MKIQTILVPVDFSSRMEPAILHGSHIARQFNALPIFLHVVPQGPYPPAFVGAFPLDVRWIAKDESMERLRAELDRRVAASLAAGTSRETIVTQGDPAEVIAATVAKRKVDLVVMPTAGTGAFRRWVLGSTTTKVLNDVKIPVLTGAHVEDISAFSMQPYARIGCAVDLGKGSEETLAWAKGFSDAYNSGPITVIHAVPAPGIAMASGVARGVDLKTDMEQQAEEKLRSLLAGMDIQAETLVEIGWATSIIPRAAKEADLDLLVIGRHSDDGVFAGLRTEAHGIISRSPCPVVSV